MAGLYFNFSSFEHALLGCRCNGATFEHANLRNVAVWNADFSGVNFGQADIAGSKWASVNFTGSNIEKAVNHAHVVLMANPIGLTGYQQEVFSKPCLQIGCPG
jgi:hypothetical protein